MSNTSTRIIGVGSPFGADRIGWDAIEQLRHMRLPYPVEFVTTDRPGAGLLEVMRGACNVVLIDALIGGTPGDVSVVTPQELAQLGHTSSHGFGVGEALALADALDELPARLLIVAIAIGDGSLMPAIHVTQLHSHLLDFLQANSASTDYS